MMIVLECYLNGNRLVSGSFDKFVKVWFISDVKLMLIKEIKDHIVWVNKVIPLSKGRFASCSNDGTVRIWKDDNIYNCISKLKHKTNVTSILQLRGKEILVSSGYESSFDISFWNLNDYTKQNTIEGHGVDEPIQMIKLSNGNIALSSRNEPYPIVIIDNSIY